MNLKVLTTRRSPNSNFLNLIIFRNKNKKIDPLFCSNLENNTLNLPFNWPRYHKSCQIALKHYTKTENFACHTYLTDFSNFSLYVILLSFLSVETPG